MGFVAKCFENVHQILGLKVHPGSEGEIKKELKKYPEVAAVFTSLGDYDIIVLLTIEDSRELTHFVTEKVDILKGVKDTNITAIRK